MTYTRRNLVEEQQEASQKIKQLAAICEQLHFHLDPVDWKQHGMRAIVYINGIEIAPLIEFNQFEADSVLRRVRINLLAHAALQSVHDDADLKVLMWSPVDVTKPEEFLSLWIVTLETDERIAIAERIKDGQRVYEPYPFNGNDREQCARLFGPASEGDYQPGETVTLKEREREFTGEVLYSIPPGKVVTSRKPNSRGYHASSGASSASTIAARYIVDCKDGFPHIVNQTQVSRQAS
ncbi:hypothetical protein KDH_19990 [Dictyobacter sp. S3.2.2.5]|uniref:Uncharacterized protein n=1 Tax=Dictyobacter halimunensis TaxID=3026934 RepID=A0ABQ6FN93_9CHLR|nr:hypothetical protein KDH_19990 [Dictyobacter sp. S3.2.2.5]